VTLKAPAERIVVGFNFEEFKAVSWPGGRDRVVGFDHNQWENNRRVSWVRYQAVIPRLSTFADIGNTEKGTSSVERVLGMKPDLLITLAAGCIIRAQWNSECAALTSDGRGGREGVAMRQSWMSGSGITPLVVGRPSWVDSGHSRRDRPSAALVVCRHSGSRR
jgi:hypothetical protein